jgi:hypothetical protein
MGRTKVYNQDGFQSAAWKEFSEWLPNEIKSLASELYTSKLIEIEIDHIKEKQLRFEVKKSLQLGNIEGINHTTGQGAGIDFTTEFMGYDNLRQNTWENSNMVTKEINQEKGKRFTAYIAGDPNAINRQDKADVIAAMENMQIRCRNDPQLRTLGESIKLNVHTKKGGEIRTYNAIEVAEMVDLATAAALGVNMD